MSQLLTDDSPYARRFLVGVVLNALGGGLTLPVLVVYLYRVAGLSLSASTSVLAWMAILGLAVNPIVGTVVDRVGPRPVLMVAILIEAVGVALWSQVRSMPAALAVGVLVSLGNGGIWPPQTTMMARMVPESVRQRFFGIQFMALNFGLGAGGLISSMIVRTDDPGSFTRLFVLDAFSYLVFFGFIASMRGIGGKWIEADASAADTGSYREVFADRRLIRLSTLSVIMMLCGYASMDAGMPAMLTTVGGLDVRDMGPLWASNTTVIVLLQLVVLPRLEGRSRTRLLAVACAIWAGAWLLNAIALTDKSLTFALACIAAGVFAVGETLWSPVGNTLLNVIAPEHLRGRYNAMGGLAWVLAGTIGPLYSGVMLQRGWATAWLISLAVGLAIAAGLALRLRRDLTAVEDGIAQAAI